MYHNISERLKNTWVNTSNPFSACNEHIEHFILLNLLINKESIYREFSRAFYPFYVFKVNPINDLRGEHFEFKVFLKCSGKIQRRAKEEEQ